MLTTWIFVMMLEGKAQIIAEKPSEALCKQAMVRVLMMQRILRHEASGACYVRATDIEDTEKQLIGYPIENR